jgi:hypothetical protein
MTDLKLKHYGVRINNFYLTMMLPDVLLHEITKEAIENNNPR